MWLRLTMEIIGMGQVHIQTLIARTRSGTKYKKEVEKYILHIDVQI